MLLYFALSVAILVSIFSIFFYFWAKRNIEKREEINDAIWKIDRIILNTLNYEEVIHHVVNAALLELSKYGYSILVLSLLDESKRVLRRIAISSTEEASAALKYSPIPFNTIEIPVGAKENITVKVMHERRPLETNRFADLLVPLIDPKLCLEAQIAAKIKTSIVYPIIMRDKVIGSLIFSTKEESKNISERERNIMAGFVDAVGIAMENAILYSRLQRTTNDLAQANKRLKQLDKLKDDFVSVASHELRTPMTAIRSYSWMALNKPDIPLSEKMKRYLTRTLISTERLINLVNDMLNVSRIESGSIEINPKEFDILALSDEVVQMILPKVGEKNIKVEVVREKIPTVFADPDKTTQVLLNLLGNAIKFTPQDGLITINFFTDGKVVEISVKDNGVGISKDDLGRLFQKFGRLDNSYIAAATSGGTGLGLFISKSLIELMHGKIWVTSEGQGKGATFTFSLSAAVPEVLANAGSYAKQSVGEAKNLEPVKI